MEDIFGITLLCWLTLASFGAIDNMANQTPDRRIIEQCKDKGYIAVNQTIISCSIEKGGSK